MNRPSKLSELSLSTGSFLLAAEFKVELSRSPLAVGSFLSAAGISESLVSANSVTLDSLVTVLSDEMIGTSTLVPNGVICPVWINLCSSPFSPNTTSLFEVCCGPSQIIDLPWRIQYYQSYTFQLKMGSNQPDPVSCWFVSFCKIVCSRTSRAFSCFFLKKKKKKKKSDDVAKILCIILHVHVNQIPLPPPPSSLPSPPTYLPSYLPPSLPFLWFQ